MPQSTGWPTGCYAIQENGLETDTSIELDDGLTQLNAPNFSWPGQARGDHHFWGDAVCINREGRVFQIVGGGGV